MKISVLNLDIYDFFSRIIFVKLSLPSQTPSHESLKYWCRLVLCDTHFVDLMTLIVQIQFNPLVLFDVPIDLKMSKIEQIFFEKPQ